MTAWKRALPLALTFLVVGSACADTKAKEAAAATNEVAAVAPDVVPTSLLGLAVTPETVSSVSSAKQSYVEAVSLFGLREGEQLKATLQVSRFNAAAKPRSAKFRASILNRIGGSKPRRFRMGETDVFFTTATKQTLAVWFQEDHLFILAARDDFDRPRTLVREALAIKP